MTFYPEYFGYGVGLVMAGFIAGVLGNFAFQAMYRIGK